MMRGSHVVPWKPLGEESILMGMMQASSTILCEYCGDMNSTLCIADIRLFLSAIFVQFSSNLKVDMIVNT